MACPECRAEYPLEHEPDCPRRPQLAGVTRTYCDCGGTGVRKVKDGVWRGRYAKCTCGRLVNSSGASKLAKQDALDARMAAIRKGTW